MEIELALTLTGGLLTSAKWVYEYSKKLQWEKNRFLIERLDEFRSSENTRGMERMLDWNSIHITVGGNDIFVNDDLLVEAFKTHNIKSKFSRDESKLRAIFDRYFDDLTCLVFMCDAGLIEKKNLIMFMSYWFDILNGKSKSKSKELVHLIHEYLEFYKYYRLLNFLNSIE